VILFLLNIKDLSAYLNKEDITLYVDDTTIDITTLSLTELIKNHTEILTPAEEWFIVVFPLKQSNLKI
jgi:hypothetical protein